jgi:hypothetical protein
MRAQTRFRRYRRRQVSFSCIALPDTFSVVRTTSDPIFMIYAPGVIFGGTEGVGSRFHVVALSDSCSVVPRASGPVFIFCTPELIFDSTEGVGSRFFVLRSLTRFRRFRGRLVPFSSFACPGSFSAVLRASGPVFMFCAPGHIFGGLEGDGSRFHVLRAGASFWRYRWRRVPFSSFALPDMFLKVRRASGPFYMFCAP